MLGHRQGVAHAQIVLARHSALSNLPTPRRGSNASGRSSSGNVANQSMPVRAAPTPCHWQFRRISTLRVGQPCPARAFDRRRTELSRMILSEKKDDSVVLCCRRQTKHPKE